MNTELKKQFKEMFNDVKTYKFSKKDYEPTFSKAYSKYKGFLEELAIACSESESNITELGAVLPELFKAELDAIPSKRKKEALQMDGNTNMVTYIVPLLDYDKNPNLDLLVKSLIEQWNSSGTGSMPIGRASFDEIQGGFKSRLCYITTAVCENLQAEDNCYELNILRKYRDQYLLSEKNGDRLIGAYYDIAPTIVTRIERQKNAKSIYKNLWKTYLKPCVTHIENNENEACKVLYTKMVKDLQNQYIYS